MRLRTLWHNITPHVDGADWPYDVCSDLAPALELGNQRVVNAAPKESAGGLLFAAHGLQQLAMLKRFHFAKAAAQQAASSAQLWR